MEANLQEDRKFSDLSDDDLIKKIKEIQQSLPDSGVRILMGTLRASGVVVQRLIPYQHFKMATQNLQKTIQCSRTDVFVAYW
jgi:hypothetical protein